MVKLAMMVALADTIRPNTHATLDWLRRLSVQTAMITGDKLTHSLGREESIRPGRVHCRNENRSHKLSWIMEKQAGEDDIEDDKKQLLSQLLLCTSRRLQSFGITWLKTKALWVWSAMASTMVQPWPQRILGLPMGAGGTALAVEAARCGSDDFIEASIYLVLKTQSRIKEHRKERTNHVSRISLRLLLR
ncbi:hypothetical protein OS493_019729 [Desmophyllum pertusum]|uniref:Uncharacterized protein n=1 Tax=Desmophyllum pertusum TaxID=174260 RepID=A0A9X0CQU4_9CNID|nr:hypothetical protein OS493_019729 [Desmophyllum pertusum]